MEKIRLQHHPSGISATVDVNAFAPLKDELCLTCQRFADLPPYNNMGASVTSAKLDLRSRDFAVYLQGTPGTAQGGPGRDQDAQPAAVPGRVFWCAELRCWRIGVIT